MVAVAFWNRYWCSPDAMADCQAYWPDSGVGLLFTQFQAQGSPPSEPAMAPAGTESSTHTTLATVGVKSVVAKTRRPSGRVASASTHWLLFITGVNVMVWPMMGSASRVSHTIFAPVKSTPGADSENCTLPLATVEMVIWPGTAFHGCVLRDVCAASHVRLPRARAWFRMTNSSCTFQLSPQRS